MLRAMPDKHPAFVRVREDIEAGREAASPQGIPARRKQAHRGISKLSLLWGPEVDISERCRAACVLYPLLQGTEEKGGISK